MLVVSLTGAGALAGEVGSALGPDVWASAAGDGKLGFKVGVVDVACAAGVADGLFEVLEAVLGAFNARPSVPNGLYIPGEVGDCAARAFASARAAA